MTTLRIATRKSPLALWQAHHVSNMLLAAHPEITIKIIPFVTEGDRRLETPLAMIGGKGLFVKEIERALLDHEADIAVHSIKDMPFSMTESLVLAAICEREDPRDAFVSNQYMDLRTLPKNATVGTSSPRRTSLLREMRPDICIQSIRGNVGTRLDKLDHGDYDALILAAAGLKRLNLEHRITGFLETTDWIPAPGQGAIGVVCRQDDAVLQYLSTLDHQETRICVTAERAVNETLEGGCQLPIAAHAIAENDVLSINGLVGHPQKNHIIRASNTGSTHEAKQLGVQLAHQLLDLGAREILQNQLSK